MAHRDDLLHEWSEVERWAFVRLNCLWLVSSRQQLLKGDNRPLEAEDVPCVLVTELPCVSQPPLNQFAVQHQPDAEANISHMTVPPMRHLAA